MPSLSSLQHPLRKPSFFAGSVFPLIFLVLLVVSIARLCALEVDPARSVIVLPMDRDDRVREAADELQKHLALIAGKEIPIVDEGQAPEGVYAFFVGVPFPGDDKPLAPEEARWRVTPQAAYFYGEPKSLGVQFAVYNFLEDQLGVRWIEPGDKGIAYEKQLPIKLKVGDSAWAPELLLRKIRTSWRTGKYPNLAGRDYVRDFTEYVRSDEEHDAHSEDVAMWQKRMRMGGHDVPGYGHAFTTWWRQYGMDHPEYFAMLENGKREPHMVGTLPNVLYTDENPRGFQEVKMCPSSPALVQQIIQNWVDSGRRSPWINVCENDGSHGYCVCEECQKLDVTEEGEKPMSHLTDRYVHLANEVAREARKIDPDAGVVMYAYDRYMLPPRREKLEPNVAVGFVPTTVDLDELEELYGGWEKAGAKLLMLRPNYHTYYNTMLIPVGFEEHMFKVFQIAYKNGARAADYDSLVGNWPITGLSDYILARTFSDPEKPLEYWMDQYFSAFGAASEDVRRYFAYWRNEVWNKRLLPDLGKLDKNYIFARNLMQILDQYYTPADFETTDAILEEASQKQLTDGQREKLHALTLANQHARLVYNAAVAQGQEKFVEAGKLLDFRKEHSAKMNVNWIGVFAGETRFFGDVTGVGRTAALREYALPWLNPGVAWRFKMDPENVGETEQWQLLTWNQTEDWDRLRVDSNWENPYRSETDPKLAEKLKDYDGVAWYATRVTIPNEMADNRIYLYFGGVDESCWVYVNGEFAGSHLSEGTTEVGPFAIEIGPYLNLGQNFQEIMVRVEDKGGRGGLTKPLWLVSKKNEDQALNRIRAIPTTDGH